MQYSNVEINNPLISVVGDVQDMMPVMEGIVVSFSCHFEFILTGPNSSMCMRNGEWEPDPREVDCRHKGRFRLYHLIIVVRNPR